MPDHPGTGETMIRALIILVVTTTTLTGRSIANANTSPDQ